MEPSIRMMRKGYMFQLHEKVFYPGHGIADVESIVEKTVAGNKIEFFKLCFLFKDMTILVPIHNLEGTGVRHLSDEKTIDRAINELFVLPEKKIEQLDLSPSGWNRRNKDYQLKIQNGKLLEIVKIYRDLMHISLQKELSFGEKNLLHSTEDLIVQEILTVRNQERTEILQELRAPFKQFMLSQDTQQQTTA